MAVWPDDVSANLSRDSLEIADQPWKVEVLWEVNLSFVNVYPLPCTYYYNGEVNYLPRHKPISSYGINDKKEGLWTRVAIFTVVSPPECHRGKFKFPPAVGILLKSASWQQVGVGGGGLVWPWLQKLRASLLAEHGVSCNRGGRIWWIRSEEPAADARKAEGASWTALLIPRPPDRTGSNAWAQAELLLTRSILALSLRIDLWRWLNSSSWDERKHGEERRIYSILGI